MVQKKDNPDDLFALVLKGNERLCPSCAHDRYPDGEYPPDSTPVFNYDDWKTEVSGLCASCKTFVGEGESEDLGDDDNENSDDDGNDGEHIQ